MKYTVIRAHLGSPTADITYGKRKKTICEPLDGREPLRVGGMYFFGDKLYKILAAEKEPYEIEGEESKC